MHASTFDFPCAVAPVPCMLPRTIERRSGNRDHRLEWRIEGSASARLSPVAALSRHMAWAARNSKRRLRGYVTSTCLTPHCYAYPRTGIGFLCLETDAPDDRDGTLLRRCETLPSRSNESFCPLRSYRHISQTAPSMYVLCGAKSEQSHSGAKFWYYIISSPDVKLTW